MDLLQIYFLFSHCAKPGLQRIPFNCAYPERTLSEGEMEVEGIRTS